MRNANYTFNLFPIKCKGWVFLSTSTGSTFMPIVFVNGFTQFQWHIDWLLGQSVLQIYHRWTSVYVCGVIKQMMYIWFKEMMCMWFTVSRNIHESSMDVIHAKNLLDMSTKCHGTKTFERRFDWGRYLGECIKPHSFVDDHLWNCRLTGTLYADLRRLTPLACRCDNSNAPIHLGMLGPVNVQSMSLFGQK